jgi:hypothetical protein
VAHAARSPAEPEELAKSAELQYALTEVTYALLCLILLAELGLPAEVQQRVAVVEPLTIATAHFADATRP